MHLVGGSLPLPRKDRYNARTKGATKMSTIITGIVTNGVVVPNTPLPEGAHVEIHLSDNLPDMPEVHAELAAWQQGSLKPLPWWNNWPKRKRPMKKGDVWRAAPAGCSGAHSSR